MNCPIIRAVGVSQCNDGVCDGVIVGKYVVARNDEDVAVAGGIPFPFSHADSEGNNKGWEFVYRICQIGSV